MRDSVIMYKSTYLAILKRITNHVQREAVFEALFNYAFFDEPIPELFDPVSDAILDMAKPLIDSNNKNYVNGCKGGRPKKDTEHIEKTNGKNQRLKPTDKPTDKPTEKGNVNKDEEENKNDNEDSYFTLKEGDTLPPSADAGGASTFTLIECQECAADGKVNLTEEGIEAFYNRMEKDGWKIKGDSVTNLLMAMRGFAKNHKRYQNEAQKNKVHKSFKPWLQHHGYDSNYDKNGDFENEISVGEDIVQSIFEVSDPNESMYNINERLIDDGFSKEDIKPIMMLFHKWVREKNKG